LEKSAKIVITVLVVLAIAAGIVITFLTLLGGPEWIKFMIVLALVHRGLDRVVLVLFGAPTLA
jgi:hypothetical protein